MSFFSRLIKVITSGCILFLIFASIDFSIVYTTVLHISLWPWLFILMLLALDRSLLALRWKYLLMANDLILSFHHALHIYLMGNFIGAAFPGFIGVDIFRLYGLKASGFNLVASASSIIWERMLGMGSLVFIGSLGVIMAMLCCSLPLGNVLIVSFLMALSIIILLYFLLHRGFLPRVTHFLPRFMKVKYGEKLDHILCTFENFRVFSSTMIIVLCITILDHLVIVTIAILIAKSIGSSVSIIYFFSLVPAMMLIERIPISFNGLGVREGLSIIFFTKVGMLSEEAFSLSILSQLVYLISLVPGFVLFLLWRANNPLAKKSLT